MDRDTGTYVGIWESSLLPTPNSPVDTVVARFDQTLAMAYEMKELLVGTDGTSGYLGAINNALTSAPSVTITAPTVDTTGVFKAAGTAPVFDRNDLSDIPDGEYPDPDQMAVPMISTGDLSVSAAPTTVNPALVWGASGFSNDIYQDILDRILQDLTAGATGLDPDVEDALLARSRARQQAANLTTYNKLNLDMASRGFQMPSGPVVGALVEFSNEMLRQETDHNNQILITQAELAQKNSQFVIDKAIALETLLRQAKDSEDKNALEHARYAVTLLIQDYSERVKAWIAGEEAKKISVEAQAKNLEAAIAYNKGQVELFTGKYAALSARIDGAAKRNAAVASVFNAEMQGYAEGTRAISSENESMVKQIEARISAADLALRAAIANANSVLAGYASESELKVKVSTSLGQLAEQAMAAMLNAVNASASLGYSGQESKSESWNHGESLHESHSYQHDPAA